MIDNEERNTCEELITVEVGVLAAWVQAHKADIKVTWKNARMCKPLAFICYNKYW